ncbi:MAG: hypothetical protein AAGF77_01130 [Bacteroidota bacterium]
MKVIELKSLRPCIIHKGLLKGMALGLVLVLTFSCNNEEEGTIVSTMEQEGEVKEEEISVTYLAENFDKELPLEEIERLAQRYKALSYEEQQEFIELRHALALKGGKTAEKADALRDFRHAVNDALFKETGNPVNAVSNEVFAKHAKEQASKLPAPKGGASDRGFYGPVFCGSEEFLEQFYLHWFDNEYTGFEWNGEFLGYQYSPSLGACQAIFQSDGYNAAYFIPIDVKPKHLQAQSVLVTGSLQWETPNWMFAREVTEVVDGATGVGVNGYTQIALNAEQAQYWYGDDMAQFADDIQFILNSRVLFGPI